MCVKDGGRRKLFLMDEGDLYMVWWFGGEGRQGAGEDREWGGM